MHLLEVGKKVAKRDQMEANYEQQNYEEKVLTKEEANEQVFFVWIPTNGVTRNDAEIVEEVVIMEGDVNCVVMQVGTHLYVVYVVIVKNKTISLLPMN